MRKKWPCPCCGHLTLSEGPGGYDGCPVCYWEDDGTQLRWPLSDDGANGISLVAAQANYQRIGACHERFRDKVRPPRRDEPLDEGWRPVDPHADRLEDHDAADRRRWPADPARLYYWRRGYYTEDEPGPAPTAEPTTPAEELMAHILDLVPEARPIDEEVRRTWEDPAPMQFCARLGDLLLDAYTSGNTDLAARLVEVLNTGLTDGDPHAYNCVAISFLEPVLDAGRLWHRVDLDDLTATWPPELRAEITRMREHAATPWTPPRPDRGPIHLVRWWRRRLASRRRR